MGLTLKKEYQQTDQSIRIEIPEINPHVCGQRVPIQFNGERKVSSTDGAGKNGYLHANE